MRRTGRRAGVLAAAVAVQMTMAWPAAAQTTTPALALVIDRARLWVVGFLSVVATLYLVVGGARYVFSGGDPGEVERAKHTIGSALKGYALAVLAPIAMTILRSIVGSE